MLRVVAVWCTCALAGLVGCGGDEDLLDVYAAEVVSGPPTISSFTPGAGTQATSVLVLGTNFTPSIAVAFNGTPSTQVTYVNAGKLRAIVPTGATTGPIT